MVLFDLWLRFMKWGLIIAFPVMTLVFVCLPIVDRLIPWQEAEAAVDDRFGDGIRLCVGMGSSSTATKSERQRSFMLLNRMEVATVFGSSAGKEQVVTVESSRFAFWFVLLFVFMCAVLSIRFSFPQISAKIKSSRTSRCETS